MAITMAEIARKLNISIATVSRALSGKQDSVSPSTRQAILELAQQHGYRRRKTVGRSVAFVIDKESFKLSSQFYERVISGVESALVANHYYFQFNSVERRNFDLKHINLNFDDLAGVILVGVYHDDFVMKLRDMQIPMVLVDYYIPTEDIDTVLIDNADGVLKACKHLCSLGHRRVACVCGDKMETSTHERHFGYQRGKEIFGLDDDPALEVGNCLSRVDEGFKAMNTLFDRRANPTAVLAYNDIVALGVMEAIKHKGMAIPRDISVVGFDDIALASEVVPSLTTVHVPKRTIGRKAVERLLQIIKGRQDPVKKLLVPTRLELRQSTGPAAQSPR
jgi:LacI family transcriptional regulator